MLKVSDYTNSADLLLDHLSKKFPEGVCVSDIKDVLGRQYVDLVQEGGGVHGIALAGYTYILEKMGVSFMKMAGTSAGSINTLLLNAVNTKEEATRLNLKGKYYETRSQKVLEYLSDKDLRDFVDGPPLWKNLIFALFAPAFKRKGIKGFIKQYKNLLIVGAICTVLLIFSGFMLIYDRDQSISLWAWLFRLSFVGVVLIVAVIYLRVRYAGKLYKLLDRFGINPGDNFEKWLITILKENHIESVEDLTLKFEKEKELLKPQYIPCRSASIPTPETDDIKMHEDLFKEIEDDSIKVDIFYARLCEISYSQENWDEPRKDAFWNQIIKSFETRLAKDPVITKEIVIVSSDITHGLKVEFPGMHKMYWGNDTTISPARYVRASMSVPFFFRPMEIEFDKKEAEAIQIAWRQILKVPNELKNHALFVDGGMLSNFPINVFYNSTMPVPRKPTFGIKLQYENEIDSRTIKTFMEYGGSILNTMRFFYDRDFALKQDLYKKTVRSIDTGKVHWLNFNLSDKEKLELFFRGSLAATIFLSKYKTNDKEIEDLVSLGKKVPIPDGTFSIYGEDGVNFQIEDSLIENISFEWQSYKIERLIDRLSKEERKDQLKGSAALQNLKT